MNARSSRTGTRYRPTRSAASVPGPSMSRTCRAKLIANAAAVSRASASKNVRPVRNARTSGVP